LLSASRTLAFARFAGSLIRPSSYRLKLASALTTARPLAGERREWITRHAYASFVNPSSTVADTQSRELALGRAGSVLGSDRTETVYNLTVEDQHEYYANGILVANCDALRYFFVNFLDPNRAKDTMVEMDRWKLVGRQ
jgi:hypothetical protein